MDVVDIARWQFGIITVYHFLFVPISIGLSAIVAGFETAWVRTGNEQWLRLTKFFGKLFLINFAIGVVTGIVQEFQFGMNWSDYSRFVGDIFGAPLAIEGLLAFFLESTFLGLWLFGWDVLPKRLHLLTAWMVAIGSAMERGTEPSAAWCSTMSAPAQAARHTCGSAMLPSMKRWRFQASAPTATATSSRLRRWPVAKLSTLTTRCPSRSSASSRCEPMKPADPVSAQASCRPASASWIVFKAATLRCRARAARPRRPGS